jgi:hypothetical protein
MNVAKWRFAMGYEWYGVKTVYMHEGLAEKPAHQVYEERVVVMRARGQREAIRRAEREARAYCSKLKNTRYLGYLMLYVTSETQIYDGTEVFSLMRESPLNAAGFLNRYFDEETECAQRLTDRAGRSPRKPRKR